MFADWLTNHRRGRGDYAFAEPPAFHFCLNLEKKLYLSTSSFHHVLAQCTSLPFPGPHPHARNGSWVVQDLQYDLGFIYLEKEKGRRGGQGRREALVSTKKGGEGQGSAQVGGESFLPGQQALPCWKD